MKQAWAAHIAWHLVAFRGLFAAVGDVNRPFVALFLR